jgi:hypothetical protein
MSSSSFWQFESGVYDEHSEPQTEKISYLKGILKFRVILNP